MAALSIWDMGFFEIESRQRHAQRLSSFHHSSPSHVLYTPPALPHCSQGSPHTPSTHSCPAQPNIYAFTYVLVLYIRSPPAEKKGRNGLANQLDATLDAFQAREITRLKGSHVYVLHHNPLNVTDGGFLDPPDCAFTPPPSKIRTRAVAVSFTFHSFSKTVLNPPLWVFHFVAARHTARDGDAAMQSSILHVRIGCAGVYHLSMHPV